MSWTFLVFNSFLTMHRSNTRRCRRRDWRWRLTSFVMQFEWHSLALTLPTRAPTQHASPCACTGIAALCVRVPVKLTVRLSRMAFIAVQAGMEREPAGPTASILTDATHGAAANDLVCTHWCQQKRLHKRTLRPPVHGRRQTLCTLESTACGRATRDQTRMGREAAQQYTPALFIRGKEFGVSVILLRVACLRSKCTLLDCQAPGVVLRFCCTRCDSDRAGPGRVAVSTVLQVLPLTLRRKLLLRPARRFQAGHLLFPHTCIGSSRSIVVDLIGQVVRHAEFPVEAGSRPLASKMHATEGSVQVVLARQSVQSV